MARLPDVDEWVQEAGERLAEYVLEALEQERKAQLRSLASTQIVYCKDCEFLMYSDCYGECRRGYLGIVRPRDYCSRGLRREEGKHDQD